MWSNRYLPIGAAPASVGWTGKECFLKYLKSWDYIMQSLEWLFHPPVTNILLCTLQLKFSLVHRPTTQHPACSSSVAAAVYLAPGLPFTFPIDVPVSPASDYLLDTQVLFPPIWEAGIQEPFVVTTPWPRCLNANSLSLLLFPCNPLHKIETR